MLRYTARLNLHTRTEHLDAGCFRELDACGLGRNADVLSAKAARRYCARNFVDANRLLTESLGVDPVATSSISTRIACLYYLKRKEELFRLAHRLVDEAPNRGASWYVRFYS